jgi:hypothetical protein
MDEDRWLFLIVRPSIVRATTRDCPYSGFWQNGWMAELFNGLIVVRVCLNCDLCDLYDFVILVVFSHDFLVVYSHDFLVISYTNNC